MKTEDILNIDCRKESGNRKLQKILLKIPQIEKAYNKQCEEGEEIPIEILEKMLHQLSIRKKYIVMNIQPFYGKEHNEFIFYTSSAKRIKDNVWIGNAYGITIYETIAKLIILIYADIKNPKKSSIKED